MPATVAVGKLALVDQCLADFFDKVGIFGREALDLASLWVPPATTDPGAYAFRMYRNYDGTGSGFGEFSVQANSANQDSLAVYAALRNADGALTLIVINKTGSGLTSDLALSGFNPASTAQVYRYSPANLGAIVRVADQPVNASGFGATFPGSSITLIVLPPAGSGATPTPTKTPIPIPTATRTPLPLGTTSHVGDIDGVGTRTSNQQWKATVTILVHDNNHNPVGNATVSGTWSSGPVTGGVCTTNSTGQCSIVQTGLAKGRGASVTFTVSGIKHASLTYSGTANHDPEGDSNGTSIRVVAP